MGGKKKSTSCSNGGQVKVPRQSDTCAVLAGPPVHRGRSSVLSYPQSARLGFADGYDWHTNPIGLDWLAHIISSCGFRNQTHGSASMAQEKLPLQRGELGHRTTSRPAAQHGLKIPFLPEAD
ncbi:unnamed protein product [Caretta caretta]